MFLKRILEKQLELNDEGNPAWGENTGYYDGKQEDRDITRFTEAYNQSNNNKTTFIEQVRALSNSHSVDKLVSIKSKIKDKARISTERKTRFNFNLYDSNVIELLIQEGFNVVEEGDFITVSW